MAERDVSASSICDYANGNVASAKGFRGRLKSICDSFTAVLKKRIKSDSGGDAKGSNARGRRLPQLLKYLIPHVKFVTATMSSMPVRIL